MSSPRKKPGPKPGSKRAQPSVPYNPQSLRNNSKRVLVPTALHAKIKAMAEARGWSQWLLIEMALGNFATSEEFAKYFEAD